MHTKSKVLVQLSAFTIAGVLSYTALQAGADSTVPHRGRIPEHAFRAKGGAIDTTQVPNFVPASARDGSIAGYVRKEDVFGAPQFKSSAQPQKHDVPVFDEGLQRVVGHMVPGRGFVAFGEDPEKTPPFTAHEGSADDE